MIEPTPRVQEQYIKNIEKQIALLPNELRRQYPQHIFEPIRLEIARELAVKECYKLLPFLSKSNFKKLHETMGLWFIGGVPDVAPIHDFWNVLEGLIVSLKGKDIIALLTSANMQWQPERIDATRLSLYWPIGNGGLEACGQPPYSYDMVKKRILDTSKRNAELKLSDAFAANTNMARDDFPIIVRRNIDGSFQLLDGNRRTFRAWLQGRREITAWVGIVTASPALHNHWINKGFLRRLVAEYMNNPTPELKDVTRNELAHIFAASEIARIQYHKYCIPYNKIASELVEGLSE